MAAFTTASWADRVDADTLARAGALLQLIGGRRWATGLIALLEAVDLDSYPAEHILTAARLPLLIRNDRRVGQYLVEAANGRTLAPILAVRTRAHPDLRGDLIVADGYPRLCAAIHTDPYMPIPCAVAGITGR